ncbi:replication protein A 70 kDa DNA-binding subunit-like isoform X1 [Branchiostoma floridae]|uniref:Replication protein A subunit n=2 Tax=Branchiostoma floridae TaxID=7739 RepID=A0A9J7LYP2_BRAFL|nr:replication protein A 70 kDa DNA-binding subunit-like isoform X1 [Branchiostoma floridae]
MAFNLHEGSIQEIANGGSPKAPVLQVLGIKKIQSAGAQGSERYRLLLSDGKHTQSSAMLATQQNSLVHSQKLQQNCVIRLEKYICNTIQDNRRVLIMLEVQVLGNPGNKIKNPTPVNQTGGGTAPAPVQNAFGSSNFGHGRRPLTSVPQPSFYRGGAAHAVNGGMNRSGNPGAGARPNQGAAGSSFYGRSNVTASPGTPGRGKPTPIAGLNPYQNRWTIRARVTNKGSIRTWNNARGEGKLFSMDLLDESGEIRATAFNDQCDKFYDLIEIGKVYFFSKGSLKTANKQYTSIQNDYEMSFNNDTTVVLCEDEADLPSIQYNFVPIEKLEEMNPNTIIDLIGVCKSYGEVTTITTRQTNREVNKRDLQVVDMSGKQVNLTLWGGEADKFDGSSSPVVAIKGARLSDFGGRSLSTVGSSTIMINPDIPEAYQLRGWYDKVGCNAEAQSISTGAGGGAGRPTNWKSFQQVKDENLGTGEKPDFFTTKGTIVFLKKENSMYQACPTQDCNKKVVDLQNGFFSCEKCSKEFPNFKYRMILSANVADFSGNQWTTCFQETAETILGQNTEYLGNLKDQDDTAYDQVFTEANFKSYIFNMRVKMDTYNDESRIRCICNGIQPLDFKEYSKKLINDIRQMALM